MTVADALSAPWAIIPERLTEIQEIYARHLRGEKSDITAIEAALGRKMDNTREPYTVRDGIAIIPVHGIIAKRMNLFTQISGGVSTQLLADDLLTAEIDGQVRAIVLDIDSPGGTVDGTQAAAVAVRATANTKPVIACANGMMASAAYWIGCAAREVYLADETTGVGSIGVVQKHTDQRAYEDKVGIYVTELTAGHYKRLANERSALSSEAFREIQEQLEQIYSLFVRDVAKYRGHNEEEVRSGMADGRMFIGAQAVSAGLADGIRSLDEIVAGLCMSARTQCAPYTVHTGANAPQLQGETMSEFLIMGRRCTTQEEVTDAVEFACDDAAHAALDEAEEGMQERLRAARIAAAAAETKRILDVQAQSLPGHEALIAEMVADGTTTGTEAAVRVLAAEKARAGQFIGALVADAPTPAPAVDAPALAPPESFIPKSVAIEAADYVREEADKGHRVSFADAVKHVTQK